MKTLGLILIAIAVILMGGAIFAAIHKHLSPDRPVLEAEADNGQTMGILPLLSIISLATGGALIVASIVTKKP